MKHLLIGLALSLLGCADDPAQSRTSIPQGDVTISIAMEAATPLTNNRLVLIEAGVIRTDFMHEGTALVIRLPDYPAAPAIEAHDAAGRALPLNEGQCDQLVSALTVSFGRNPPRPAVKPTDPRADLTACPFN